MEEKETESARLRQYIARRRKLFIGICLFYFGGFISLHRIFMVARRG